MHQKTIRQLISRFRGVEDAGNYFDFRLGDPKLLAESARGIMSSVPPAPGACALLSASWAGFLRSHHAIPAIVVAGDLKIRNVSIFNCKRNLPTTGRMNAVVSKKWDGHCWIEIDGLIGDLSIFRTAYSLGGASILRDYVVSQFGHGRGAMLCAQNMLPEGLRYVPKFVLDDKQINGLIAGTAHLIDSYSGE